MTVLKQIEDMNSSLKKKNKIWNCIGVIYTVLLGSAFLLVMFPDSSMYGPLRQMVCSPVILFSVSSALILGMSLLTVRYHEETEHICRFINRWLPLILLVLWILMSAFSVVSYWDSAWDVAQIRRAMLSALDGDLNAINTKYFSQHPNNILIFSIYLAIMKTAGLFGIELRIILCSFQAFLFCLTVYLTNRVMRDMTHSEVMSTGVSVLTLLFSGILPWYLIPYSDAMGLIFPILIIRIFQLYSMNHNALLLLAEGFVAYFAYKMKPQTSIAGIAVMAVLIISSVFHASERKKYIPGMIAMIIGLLGGIVIYQPLAVDTLPFEIDRERSFSLFHYMMMGQNIETYGGYYYPDVQYSESFDTYEERKEADISRLKERMQNYTPQGYGRLLIGKLARTYGDGSFGWGAEGGFFWSDALIRIEPFTSWIYQFIRSDGLYYLIWISFFHSVWLSVLLFAGIATLNKVVRDDNTGQAMLAAVIGLTLFQLIFETRARYIYTYTPVFAVLAMLGLKWAVSSIARSN